MNEPTPVTYFKLARGASYKTGSIVEPGARFWFVLDPQTKAPVAVPVFYSGDADRFRGMRDQLVECDAQGTVLDGPITIGVPAAGTSPKSFKLFGLSPAAAALRENDKVPGPVVDGDGADDGEAVEVAAPAPAAQVLGQDGAHPAAGAGPQPQAPDGVQATATTGPQTSAVDRIRNAATTGKVQDEAHGGSETHVPGKKAGKAHARSGARAGG